MDEGTHKGIGEDKGTGQEEEGDRAQGGSVWVMSASKASAK